MKSFRIHLYYYIGHVIWLTCMRYWYIPGSYMLYNLAMSKSAALDTECILWSKLSPDDERD